MWCECFFDYYVYYYYWYYEIFEVGCYGWCGGLFGGDCGDVLGDMGGLCGGGCWGGGGCMFGYGDLCLLLLVLIEQQLCYGYELICIIEEMFNGQYLFSLGVIYFIFIMLEEIGYVVVQLEVGGCKSYVIIDEGCVFVEENCEVVEVVMEQICYSVCMVLCVVMLENVYKVMYVFKYVLLMCGIDWSKVEGQCVVKILVCVVSEIVSGNEV